MCKFCKDDNYKDVNCECECKRKIKVNHSYDVCADCKHIIYVIDYFMMRIWVNLLILY